MKILPPIHTSKETAYVIPDYPYGFRLRCSRRYWIEHSKIHGFRLCTQTSNPKRNNDWSNKPKYGTYCKFGLALYLDDENHVKGMGLTEYCSTQDVIDFKDKFSEGLTAEGLVILNVWLKMKQKYDELKAEGKVKTFINGIEVPNT